MVFSILGKTNRTTDVKKYCAVVFKNILLFTNHTSEVFREVGSDCAAFYNTISHGSQGAISEAWTDLLLLL